MKNNRIPFFRFEIAIELKRAISSLQNRIPSIPSSVVMTLFYLFLPFYHWPKKDRKKGQTGPIG